MNLCPISEDEREKLRAEHRERVRRVNEALLIRYKKADEEAAQKRLDEEEYARMENEGGPSE